MSSVSTQPTETVTPFYGYVSGIFDIQRFFINDVNAAASTDISAGLQTVVADLKDLSSNNLNDVNVGILTKIDDVNQIITNEQTRLKKKEESINEIEESKMRMITLNNNYAEKKKYYTKMLIALAIGLALCLTLFIVGMYVPIPLVVNVLFIAVVFAIVSIYCLKKYMFIATRNSIHFDQANINPPRAASTQTTNQQNVTGDPASSNNNGTYESIDSGALSTCVGSLCCSTGTVWDVSGQKCFPNKESFTGFSSKEVQEFSPCEFDSYSAY